MILKKLICCAVVFVFVSSSFAQQQTPKTDEQDRIRIFTQEIVLPIVAYDVYGHFDPTISADDVLVLEDGVAQQVKSARRIPLNVVLLIDMGSVVGFTQHLDITRTIASAVISRLRPGDKMALIQFTNRAEVLQDWTDDSVKVRKAFDPEHGKVLSGSRSRMSEGLKATVDKLKEKEIGSTHVVLITDGDDAPGSDYAATVNQLLRLQPTVHMLSYTTLARAEVKKRKPGMFFDRAMKRFYNEYDDSLRESEQRLTILAENFGGRIFLPGSTDEAVKQGKDLAGEIGATCVLTYTPKRPLDFDADTKPRRLEVFPRRTGLRVRALRTTVTSVFNAR
jgi:von Willebrand factor type A domain